MDINTKEAILNEIRLEEKMLKYSSHDEHHENEVLASKTNISALISIYPLTPVKG